jgi:DNA-binding MarR family transcriptional regulator
MSLLPILNQPPHFASIEEETVLALMQAAEWLARPVEALFKQSELSPAQFNVLKILRRVGEEGLPCGQICEQMITRDPDMTRLLDRLEKRALITRSRDDIDRRVVRARITTPAIDLLATLDGPLAELHRKQLSHMKPERLRVLIELLRAAQGDSQTNKESPDHVIRD